MALTATLDNATNPTKLTVVSDFRKVTGTVTATSGGQTASADYTIVFPLTITDSAHTWTKVSDDGTTAVYSY